MTGAEKFALAMALWRARHVPGTAEAKAQYADSVAQVAIVACPGRERATFEALCYADNGGWRYAPNPFTDTLVEA